MGFTWDVDCHLYYRRSRQLSLVAGAPRRLEGAAGEPTSNEERGLRPRLKGRHDHGFQRHPRRSRLSRRRPAPGWSRPSPRTAPRIGEPERRTPERMAAAKAWQAKKGGRRLRRHHLAQGIGGGQGGTPIQPVIFGQEEAKRPASARPFHHRPGHVRAHGDGLRRTTGPSSASSARRCAARRSGASCSPNRPAARTWRPRGPRAVQATATTG